MDAILLGLLGGAGKSAARLGGQKLTDRVMDLLGLQREEIKLLKSLEGKVERILSAPYRTAMRYIEDAAAEWRSDEDRIWLLKKAHEKLTEAIELDDDTLRRSLACTQLAAVWSVLGHQNDMLPRLREARTLAIVAAQELADAKKSPRTPVKKFINKNFALVPLPSRYLTEFTVANYRFSQYRASKTAKAAENRLRLVHNYADTLRSALERLDDTVGDRHCYEVRLRERYGQLYNGNLIRFFPPILSPRATVCAFDLSYEKLGDEGDWGDRRSIDGTALGWKVKKWCSVWEWLLLLD